MNDEELYRRYSELDPVLQRLLLALEAIDQLRCVAIGGGEPDDEDNRVYDEVKGVLARHATTKFVELFHPGRVHLIRRLAQAIRDHGGRR